MKKIIACCISVLILISALSGCTSDPYVAQERAVALSWRQCPETVRRYLEYVAANPYPDGDYTRTAILDFAPSETNPANSKPVGKTINGVTYTDNVPGVPVPVTAGNNVGTLTALDPLRWINTTPAPPSGNAYSQGYNCRDLGGWPCDGGTVRYGMLVRSGELNPADKALMVDTVGIRTEINLLPQEHQARERSAWGINYVANPTDVDFAYRIDDTVRDQWELYLRTAIESVLDGKPVIFHCGAGADKTGTLAVMLLGILGCDNSAIDQDYELTVFSIYSEWRNRTYEGYVAYLNAIRAVPLAIGLPDSFRNHCVSFALSLGIPLDEINAFRAACIDGTPEEIVSDFNYNAKNLLESYGFIADKRIVAGSDKLDDESGYCCTGMIPVSPGDEIHLAGLTMDGNGVVAIFDGSMEYLNGVSGLSTNGTYTGSFGTVEIDEDGNLKWIYNDNTNDAAAYVRISGPCTNPGGLFALKP